MYIEEEGREEKYIEMEDNYYNREEIVEYINEGLRENKIEIECMIEGGRFEFRGRNKFKMYNKEGSILYYLGFNKNSYINKERYKAEKSINIGDNIFYIVLENICERPLFRCIGLLWSQELNQVHGHGIIISKNGSKTPATMKLV